MATEAQFEKQTRSNILNPLMRRNRSSWQNDEQLIAVNVEN
jgi:hypothetical protein